MRRAPVALLALAVLALAGCTTQAAPPPLSKPAPPQAAVLDWNEVFSAKGGATRFRVHRFVVLDDGWEADVSLTNDTDATLAIGGPKTTLGQQFGLMLFPTGDLAEMQRLNAAGDLPPIRRADDFTPPLPSTLERGETWSGTMRGRGALAAGRFVRLVFGTLVPVGEKPSGYPSRLLWITDNAYELR